MELGLLIGAIIIVICVLCNKLSNKIGMPVLLGFIVLGMIFGSDGVFKIPFADFNFAGNLCSVALIFIIFYGGFGTNWREGKKVAIPSLWLSSLGVLLTACLTGLFCHFVLGFAWLESFLIGSVLSSTDAASVFSVLRSKKLNLKYGTASMLELESGSNDPWAYMLTVILLKWMEPGDSGQNIFLLIAAQVFFGAIFGALISVGALWALRRIKFGDSGFSSIFVVAVALLAYALPSLIGGNGYLSAYITGIVLGNQKLEDKKSLMHFFDGITGLMQIMAFFLLGLLSFPSQIPQVLGISVAIALFLTFIGRPLVVMGILTPFRAKFSQQLLVSWAGLRGATSIIFAIMATVSSAYTKNDVFHITFCIVLLSIGIQGSLLPIISKKLHMIDQNENVFKTFNDYTEETQVQFIQLTIEAENSWNHKRISEIQLPPKTRVIMILRGQEKIIPRGKTEICENDQLILSAMGYQDDRSINLNEIKVDNSNEWVGKKIAEIMWEDCIVVMIKRNGHPVMPTGEVKIREGDTLVLAMAQ